MALRAGSAPPRTGEEGGRPPGSNRSTGGAQVVPSEPEGGHIMNDTRFRHGKWARRALGVASIALGLGTALSACERSPTQPPADEGTRLDMRIGTWHSSSTDVRTIQTGTAILLVVRSGPGGMARVTVHGPPGWNGDRPWVLPSVTVAPPWIRQVSYGTAPHTGDYRVEYWFDGQTPVQAVVSLNAADEMAPARRVEIVEVGPQHVSVRWQAAPGAASYTVSVADWDDRYDGMCAVVASTIVDGGRTSATLQKLPFKAGRVYFIALQAANVDLTLEKPSLPAQYNVGYATSRTFVPLAASSAAHAASAVEGMPRIRPSGDRLLPPPP
jgi:hypothetical protein